MQECPQLSAVKEVSDPFLLQIAGYLKNFDSALSDYIITNTFLLLRPEIMLSEMVDCLVYSFSVRFRDLNNNCITEAARLFLQFYLTRQSLQAPVLELSYLCVSVHKGQLKYFLSTARES